MSQILITVRNFIFYLYYHAHLILIAHQGRQVSESNDQSWSTTALTEASLKALSTFQPSSSHSDENSKQKES